MVLLQELTEMTSETVRPAGKSSLDYALEAGNAKISDSALLFLVNAKPLR